MTNTEQKSSNHQPSSGNKLSNKQKTFEESTIRLMTSMCLKHQAVNLSQGFPNEAPPLMARMAAAYAILTGVSYNGGDVETTWNQEEKVQGMTSSLRDFLDVSTSTSSPDLLNQYSPPMGRPDLCRSISKHYHRLYDYSIDPDSCITVTSGATEALASALRTIGRPGDRVVMFEPFHELYPRQCEIFHLKPTFVALYESKTKNSSESGPNWTFDIKELSEALSGSTALILNTPHNPTGKVFSHQELSAIVELCLKHDVYVITDDIYEHMTHEENKHILLPQAFPEVTSRTFVCNSVGKSASATGWRVGWCLHPPSYASLYRSVHDQLVLMAPHPMQYAVISYLDLPVDFFRETLREKYQSRVVMLGDALREVGFQVPTTAGGIGIEGVYYLFVRYGTVPKLKTMASAMEAAMYMIEVVGVGCVPGDNFYGTTVSLSEEVKNGYVQGIGQRDRKRGYDYLRFAACRSLEDVVEACRRIRKLLGEEELKPHHV